MVSIQSLAFQYLKHILVKKHEWIVTDDLE